VGGGVHASAGADTAPDDASPTVAALSAALLRLPQLPLSENAVVWRKLLANVVVNPVTALVSCANGALAPPLVTAAAPLAAAVGAATGAAAAAILDAAEAEEAAALARGGAAWLQNAGAGGAEQTVSAAFVRALVREALAVARTQDVRLFDPAPVPGAGAAPGATRLALAAALAAALDAVRVTCERTAGNRSSMRTDVEAGVAETEIGYLNAQVVEWGRLSGVPTPANAVVVDAIRAIERENAQKRTKTWV
jgi:ketopantoate reductase